MNIKTPVIFIKMNGNVKEKVFKVPFTYVTGFNAIDNETFIAIRTEYINSIHKSKVLKDIAGIYNRFGEIKSIELYNGGVDIVEMQNNN